MSQVVGNQEITLKGIILFIKKYYKIILKRWYIVAAMCVGFSSYFLYNAFTTKPTYKAKLTFILNDNNKSSLGGVGALLGQFGLAGGGGEGNFDKIIELSHSNRILNSALFSKTTIERKEDFFANHLIEYMDLHTEWKADTTKGLRDFTFKTGNFESFNRLENHALNKVLARINDKKDPLFESSYGKLSAIFIMSFHSTQEDLSIQLLRKIFENLSDFYVMKTTERERQTYDVLRQQKDSIYSVMRGKEVSAAQFQDFNRGLILQSEKVKGDQIQKDAQIATLAYGEMLKQFAIADFALKNNTPFIQSIDMPNAPLEVEKKSKKWALLLGLTLGFGISTFGIVFWHILKKAIHEANTTT